jgi:prolyl-tRNA synthetase
MGCYGIGITRVVAATIEQNNDENGIIWPVSIAPFDIALIPINPHKSAAVREKCDALYKELAEKGFDVLYMDTPKARLGVMLADTELMGIPHRVVVGDRGLEKGSIEYKGRRDENSQDIQIDSLMSFLTTR